MLPAPPPKNDFGARISADEDEIFGRVHTAKSSMNELLWAGEILPMENWNKISMIYAKHLSRET